MTNIYRLQSESTCKYPGGYGALVLNVRVLRDERAACAEVREGECHSNVRVPKKRPSDILQRIMMSSLARNMVGPCKMIASDQFLPEWHIV